MKNIVFVFLFIASLGFAQEENNGWKSFPSNDTSKTVGSEGILEDQHPNPPVRTESSVVPGTKVTVIDPAILAQDEKYTEFSKEHPQIKGFTILLYSGSGANSRMKARQALVSFEEEYENGVTHLAWKSPNYEVRLGDYRTKIEAQADLELIKDAFPTAFIKTDMIELPQLEKTPLTAIESK